MKMPVRYLALGDSYTVGEGVEAAASWPHQLARGLQQEGISLDPPQIVATTGWTTDELAAGIASTALHAPYDLVSLLIGVNNQYRDRPLDGYIHELTRLLSQAVTLAGDRPGRVLLASIPDWGVTRFGRQDARGGAAIGARIDAFNAAAGRLAHASGVCFIDITPCSRALPDATVADGLHPSAAQYAAWTDLILPQARQALGRIA